MQVKNEFLYRLNKLYSHTLLGDLLDNGDIDFAILDVIHELSKLTKNNVLSIDSYYTMQIFMKNRVI